MSLMPISVQIRVPVRMLIAALGLAFLMPLTGFGDEQSAKHCGQGSNLSLSIRVVPNQLPSPPSSKPLPGVPHEDDELSHTPQNRVLSAVLPLRPLNLLKVEVGEGIGHSELIASELGGQDQDSISSQALRAAVCRL